MLDAICNHGGEHVRIVHVAERILKQFQFVDDSFDAGHRRHHRLDEITQPLGRDPRLVRLDDVRAGSNAAERVIHTRRVRDDERRGGVAEARQRSIEIDVVMTELSLEPVDGAVEVGRELVIECFVRVLFPLRELVIQVC